MEHGDIVEQGSHDELIAARGAYYELYQSQFHAATRPWRWSLMCSPSLTPPTWPLPAGTRV